ncbi:hypothetical protein [Microterricola viridarii]|uniref:Phage resistance protein n=1 Tax=Microterricola viridarii TaxID=412690 RepID=A0A0X8E546_9MICO|nr:hypothetical protein [Microterricola viridarii]AMB59186.1 hypothetical protein AWU67_10280 [Microterricola viridarii]
MTALPLTTPLRDLISIPARANAADFVLRLDEGVARADRTLGDYVVTESIAESFDEALSMVEQAVTNRISVGSYIHGSFGAGKSHFMAVLHLLLSKHLPAREVNGMAPVVSKHLDVLEKQFLAVDYHLIGAKNLESALFAGYLETVTAKHPEAPLPFLHASDQLLEDARTHRELLGDEKFFATISPKTGGGWGSLATGWDADSFESALAQTPGEADRDRLVSDLTATLFTGYSAAGEWVDITSGLRTMSNHAHALGYDGIVLFLDELVLWLGQHLSDQAFIQSEASKVAKLVETGSGSLPVPFISFVARQRELAQFLGNSALGVERVSQQQTLQYWDDRFEKIQLRAADLPKIVKQRLLRPVSDDAADTLQASLARVRADGAVWNSLLADEASSGEAEFASVFPFSPALVDAMVALSNIMQRERTALTLMTELLIDGNDELTAGDVIPVGDLYDYIALGTSKPLDDNVRAGFEISARFYTDKLRPFLLNKHGLTDATAKGLARNHPFRTEDRLAKTLLIAALAPGAASLKNLTASKLHALNYGSITAFVPGMETSQALTLVRKWAEEFGEIHVAEGAVDPLVSVQLSGVDYDSILSRVTGEDTPPARRALIRTLVLDGLGLGNTTGMLGQGIPFPHVWRGQKRVASIWFGNLHSGASDFKDYDFETGEGEWKVFIDFPYAADGQSGPRDDLARVSGLRDEKGITADTITWLPNFLTATRLNDLGRLVVLEYLLAENRFDANADHLPVSDRPAARQALENNRANLRESFGRAILRAYGVAAPDTSDADDELLPTEIFTTLVPGLTIQAPVTGTLSGGLTGALEQAWKNAYPGHPDLGHSEVKRRELDDSLALVTRAVEHSGRAEGLTSVDKRLAGSVAVPLGLGSLNENVFTSQITQFSWRDEFTKWEAELAGNLTAGALRARLADRGMSRDLEDTVILAWSIVADREWVRGLSAVARPGVGFLTDDLVLRTANLPEEDAWARANAVVSDVLGAPAETYCSSGAVRRLGGAIHRAAGERVADTVSLVEQLEAHAAPLGLDTDALTGRLATARCAAELLGALSKERDPLLAISVIADTTFVDSAVAVGKSIATAASVSRALNGAAWDIISKAATLGLPQVDKSLTTLRAAAAANESAVPLVARLAEAAEISKQALLATTPAPTTQPRHVPTSTQSGTGSQNPSTAYTDVDDMAARPKAPSTANGQLSASGDRLEPAISELREAIEAALGGDVAKNVRITWQVQ